ncbi:MAG: hypothetical protein HY077_12800 [Elusimicrobia bacterium]|nr:hypothetical protein [Elusimicrobiota bacterium]
MSRRALAAGLLLLSLTAAAKDTPMAWKTEKNDLFRCELPERWRRKPLSGSGAGFLFTDGLRFISAARQGKDLKDALARRKAETPEAEVSPLKVLGRSSERLKRTYRARTDGDEGAGPREWVYEETVLVPDKAGTWELQFQSSSALPAPQPAALEAWNRFLKSFKPR